MTALPSNRRASAVGVQTTKAAKPLGAVLRDEIILILAQGNTGTDVGDLNQPIEVFANESIAGTYGYGSPINLSKEIVFKVEQGLQVWILPVGDPSAGAASVADITTSTGAASKAFTVNIFSKGIEYTAAIAKDDDQDAIALAIQTALDAQLRKPFSTDIDTGVTDNIVDLTALFQGVDGDEISLKVVDNNGKAITAAEYGVDITVTAFTGGSGNPDVATAIANIPESLKITRIISQIKDTATQDLLKQFGDDRNTPELGEIVRAYHGEYVDTTSISTVNSAKTALEALSDARINDDVNSLLPVSPLGLVVESIAETIARVTARYVLNPGKPPRGLVAEFNTSKPRTIYWFKSTQRDAMYKKGITNFELVTGFFKLFDLCVQYHPADDNIESENPPVQFNDEDSTGIGNMQFSVIETFKSEQWEAVKFIEDDDVTSNPAARKKSDVATQLDSLIGDWLDPYLFIKNVAAAKANKTITFSGTNSERVNMKIPVTSASTGRIYDMTISATKSNS